MGEEEAATDEFVTFSAGVGAGWVSGKYFAFSAGVSASTPYSIMPTGLLHFSFAPSLVMDSKVREDPFAKESVVSLQAGKAPAIRSKNRKQTINRK